MNTSTVLGAFIALAVGSSANASMLTPTFAIEASSRAGTSTLVIDSSMMQQESRSDGMSWTLAHPVQLLGNYGAVLATITEASFLVVGTETVDLSFAVMSGNALTMFMITSAVNNFGVIDPAEATASAGISVTDFDGNGANLFGEFMPGAYQARYNGGTPFANLVPNIAAGAYGTNTANADTGGAFTPLGVGVSSMQSEFHFSLSANDKAAGTSIFVVRPQVPSPGAGALAFGAFVLAGVRRRRA